MGWRDAVEDWDSDYSIRADRMLTLYCRTLAELGYEPVPYDGLDARVGDNIYGGGKYDALCHAHWMCLQAREFMHQKRRAKAYRWIGMIQGILWTGGVFSISELKEHNALPPEDWKKRRS